MLADIIVVAIVAIIAVFCIRTLIHNKKTCGSTCSMCAGCGGSCGCGDPASTRNESDPEVRTRKRRTPRYAWNPKRDHQNQKALRKIFPTLPMFSGHAGIP